MHTNLSHFDLSTAIYTSDLKRAHTTAKNVYEANVATAEKPPFTVSPILREQYFGEAEGQARFSSSALWLATNTSSPKVNRGTPDSSPRHIYHGKIIERSD